MRAATTLISSPPANLSSQLPQPLCDLQIGLAKLEKLPLNEVVARQIGKLGAFLGAFPVVLGLVQGALRLS
jgi:hypothetical protein